MKTVGCTGSDANLYGLSNILGNGNFSTNSFRKESDNIFTITNIFAGCVVLTGSQLPMKSPPSTQLGKMVGFFVSSETNFLKDLCPLWSKSPVLLPSSSQTPPQPFPSSFPIPMPGLGRQVARRPASAKPNTPGLGRPPLSGHCNWPRLPPEGICRNLIKCKLAFCSSGNFGLNWLSSKFTMKGHAGRMEGRQAGSAWDQARLTSLRNEV